MPSLAFVSRPRVRRTATGAKLREWRSLDGRYIVVEITAPGYGRWYRAIRVLASGQTLASEARHRTRRAAEQACARHRGQP